VRKRGFSLVELLIVLAVIAALIATITPVALNAIKKAQATKVAQNLKTLANAFENKLYIDGEIPASINELGRDIDTDNYGVAYYITSPGTYDVIVYTKEDVDFTIVKNILSDAWNGPMPSYFNVLPGSADTTDVTAWYEFIFTVY